MSAKLSHQIIVFITLFAILGQGLITNGYAMVANPMTHSATDSVTVDSMGKISTSDHQQLMPSSTVKQDTNAMDCHSSMSGKMPQKTSHCCDDDAMLKSKSTSKSCCDGQAGCAIDCGHCMTISMTGHLLSFDIVLAKAVNSKADATSLPHFFYHKTLPAFRPPIS
ncbi:hypothetical protein [Shewanella donghaensis]|uniref:hypothetical protein n=1 Tax=Shewanella donghaensis TaxID=238836 RepID=UPI0011829D3F|nr:hypothetical protein [Shewanella donghaensis]